jgi:proteasome accessory factor C
VRTAAATRLLRLLAIVAYLAEHGQATFDELAKRFGVPPNRLAVELGRASCYEIPPFTADPLFDLIIDDTGVTARDIATFLRRPPRLNRAEGFAVLTAGEAILATTGDDSGETGALRTSLDKLSDALGLDLDAIRLDIDRPELADRLQAAIDERRRLAVTYYTAWRDEITERRLDPIAVYLTDGNWYLEALDHRSDEVRKFRIDRVESIAETGETFERLDPPDELTSFAPGVDARAVRLHLPAEAGWVAETYPVTERVDRPDGSFEVGFDVVGTAWLERLLLRVGPDARVLEPSDLADLGVRVADRLLDLYR